MSHPTIPRPLEGKVAIVTGAAGGMGRAYALRLAKLGANIVIADRDLQVGVRFGEVQGTGVEDEVRSLGRRAIGVQADLTERTGAKAVVDATVAEFGKIDILVNNAGGAITPQERSSALRSPDEDIELHLRLNFLSTVYMCQEANQHFTRPGAAIVNVASFAVKTPSRNATYAIYGAAKAAVETYTRYLAVEVGPDGIRANCVAPGIILTPRVAAAAGARGIGTDDQAARFPLRRLGKAEDLAGAVEFFTSDNSAYITGECLEVSGGANLVMGV